MLLSVIVPIYNKAHCLHKCLDSIRHQLDDEAEILCIDDGSTDSSSVICDEYANLDKHIKVFHKINGGVSSARNLGLDLAKGEYIGWVDPDDYVAENWYKSIKTAITSKADIIKFDYCRLENNIKTNVIYGGHARYLDKPDFLRKLTQARGISSYLWVNIFASRVFSDIRFPEDISLMEDYSVLHKLIYKADGIYYAPNVLYCYSVLQDSISTTINMTALYKTVSIARERYLWLEKKGFDVSKSEYLSKCFWFIAEAIKGEHEIDWQDEIRFCQKEVKNNISCLLRADISFKDKIKYALVYMNKIKFAYNVRAMVMKWRS